MNEMNQDIINIQTKLAYMEDFVTQLQAVVVEHTNEIERLREENQKLVSKMTEMAEQMEGDIPNRRPPHY